MGSCQRSRKMLPVAIHGRPRHPKASRRFPGAVSYKGKGNVLLLRMLANGTEQANLPMIHSVTNLTTTGVPTEEPDIDEVCPGSAHLSRIVSNPCSSKGHPLALLSPPIHAAIPNAKPKSSLHEEEGPRCKHRSRAHGEEGEVFLLDILSPQTCSQARVSAS
jgi:hypothetical protein